MASTKRRSFCSPIILIVYLCLFTQILHQVSADNQNTDTCPKKGYGIIHKLKKSSKFSFEKLEEKSNNEISIFNVKVPKLTNLVNKIGDDEENGTFEAAFQRYKNALSCYVKGNGNVFLQRSPADVFTNNFNAQLMEIHEANHDVQIVCDPYGCVQYVCDYLTKGEGGVSKLLEEITKQEDITKL